MGNDLLENNSEATELSNSKERFSVISTWLYLMRQEVCLWQFREICINKGFSMRPQWTIQFCKFAQSILQESPLPKRFAVNSNKYHNKLMSLLKDRAHRNPQILGYNSQGLRKLLVNQTGPSAAWGRSGGSSSAPAWPGLHGNICILYFYLVSGLVCANHSVVSVPMTGSRILISTNISWPCG